MRHCLRHFRNPTPLWVGFLHEPDCLEVIGAHNCDCEVAVFGFAECHAPAIDFYEGYMTYGVFVYMVTSSMSKGKESTGGTLQGREGGLVSSSDKCMDEGGGGAAEGDGRGKETAPSREDSVIAVSTLPQSVDFFFLLGTIINCRGSAVDLLGHWHPPE